MVQTMHLAHSLIHQESKFNFSFVLFTETLLGTFLEFELSSLLFSKFPLHKNVPNNKISPIFFFHTCLYIFSMNSTLIFCSPVHIFFYVEPNTFSCSFLIIVQISKIFFFLTGLSMKRILIQLLCQVIKVFFWGGGSPMRCHGFEQCICFILYFFLKIITTMQHLLEISG